MKTKKILFALLLSLCLLASCVSKQTPKKIQEPNPSEKYIRAGEAYEDQGRLQSALEQYELALAVDADNRSASEHKKKVQAALYEIARQHYEKGLAFDEQGRYDEAIRQYLSVLQNWPEYTQAKEKLSPGGVSLDSKDYILHTLLDGQSVSRLSLIYYKDLNYYPIIGKFNNMADVTRVRAGDKLKIPALGGVGVEVLQKRYKAYMKERQKKREKQTGPSKSPVVAPIEQSILPQPVEPPQEPDTLEVPDKTDAPGTSEPSETAEPSDVTQAPPSREAPELEAPGPEAPEAVLPEAVPAEESTSVTPVETSADYDQAMTLFQQKKYGQAIPFFKKAQENDPDNAQIGANLFESYFQQGLVQFKKEHYLDARQSFSSAIQYNDDCDQCRTYIKTCEDTYKEKHYSLGNHYFGKEQLEKAINEWGRVEEVDPGYKDVQANLKKARTLYERLDSIKQRNTK